MTAHANRQGSQQQQLLGHPAGLSICFLTEMWERFSYYGMRTLLILYLVKYHLFSTEEASLLYGAYAGLVYMMPLIGGLLADRYLGARKAVIYGAVLLVCGHGLMAVHGPAAYFGENGAVRDPFYLQIFYLALALIITGVGFLKANISTIVGALYGPDDPRRDGGFSIFYMGINLGSLVATALVGYVGESYGWHYGFGLAGIGMLFGLLVFVCGQKLLDGRAEPPASANLNAAVIGPLNKEHSIYLSGLGLIFASWLLLQQQAIVGNLLGLSGIGMMAFLLYYGFRQCRPVERDRLLVACFLIAVQALFWALFEQQAASLTLLADQQFDRNIFGTTLLASQVQLLNPLFIVLLAPLMAWLWVALSRKNREPSTVTKFALAMMLIGIGYIIFAWGLGLDDSTQKSFLWLLFIYLALTVAELCLSPVGLSMVTKLATQKIVGLLMGTWFLFSAMGNYLAGWISALTSDRSAGAGHGAIDVAATIVVYGKIGAISLAVGIALLLLSPLLKGRMHGVH